MSNILFVIPGLKTGGTNSSLSALYSHIKDHHNIKVFTLSNNRNSLYSFDEVIIKSPVLFSCIHSKFETEKWYFRPINLIIKATRKIICKLFNYDLISYFYKHEANVIEQRFKFDYVVAFEESYPTKFVTFFKNANKIAWIHCNYDTYCPLNISEEHIYQHYKSIICVSRYTSKIFYSRYPKLKNKVNYIYNLINLQYIIEKASLPLPKDIVKQNFQYILISAGRVDPIKRFSSIPAIARSLIEKGLSFQWYIIGPIVVKDELDRLINKIKYYNVENYVHYLGNKSNPYNYFSNSDLYVCTSKSEACPMVFNEAMILNKPVVTTNFGSASEFISNGNNGIICELKEMADQIYNILINKNIYKEYQRNLTDVSNFNFAIIKSINDLFS